MLERDLRKSIANKMKLKLNFLLPMTLGAWADESCILLGNHLGKKHTFHSRGAEIMWNFTRYGVFQALGKVSFPFGNSPWSRNSWITDIDYLQLCLPGTRWFQLFHTQFGDDDPIFTIMSQIWGWVLELTCAQVGLLVSPHGDLVVYVNGNQVGVYGLYWLTVDGRDPPDIWNSFANMRDFSISLCQLHFFIFHLLVPVGMNKTTNLSQFVDSYCVFKVGFFSAFCQFTRGWYVFLPQIAIAIGVLTFNRGEGDEPLWRIGRGTRVPLQGAVDVVPLLGAIVVCIA